MNLEEFASLQLDKPLPDIRNEEQLRKHLLDASLERKPIDRALHILLYGHIQLYIFMKGKNDKKERLNMWNLMKKEIILFNEISTSCTAKNTSILFYCKYFSSVDIYPVKIQ